MSSPLRRASLALASCVAVATVVSGVATPASATPPPAALAPAVLESVRDFFDEYDVDRATQDRLISEFEAGGDWDSMSGDSVPTEVSVDQADGHSVSVLRYADGSVAVRSLEVADGESGIGGCSRSGTTYTNCTVDFWYGLVGMSFKADYSLASGKNRVINQWGASWSIGGACSTTQNYFGRPKASVARLEVQAQVCGVPYTTTFFLELSLSGNRAYYNYG